MPAASEKVYSKDAKEDSDDVVSWVSDKLASLSVEEGANDKWKITKFEKTPPVSKLHDQINSTDFQHLGFQMKMSSYIVAYANGPFTFLESSYTSPLSGKVRPLRIYSKLYPRIRYLPSSNHIL